MNSDCFTIETEPTTPISINETSNFKIKFTPGSVGEKSATLSINYKDTSKSSANTENKSYNFILKGTGIDVYPLIELSYMNEKLTPSTGEVDFNKTNTKIIAGKSYDVTIDISNTGKSNLIFNKEDCISITGQESEFFTVKTKPVETVVPNGKTTLVLSFSPKTEKSYSADICVKSNSANDEEYKFILKGNAVAGSAEATLSSLTADKGKLIPDFDSSIKDYTLEIDSSITDVIFTPVCKDKNYTSFTVDGKNMVDETVSIKVENAKKIPFVITAENGIATETYSITIDAIENYYSAKLKTLYIGKEGDYNDCLNKLEGNETNVYFTPDTTNIKFYISSENPSATVKINSKDVSQNLWSEDFSLNGSSTYEIKVVARDGITTETYSIKAVWYGYEWEEIGKLPSAAWGNTIVVYNNELNLSIPIDDKTYFYQSSDNGKTWQECSSIEYSHRMAASVVYDNKIFIIGGHNDKYEKNSVVSISNDGKNYNSYTMTFSDNSLFQNVLHSHSVVLFKDRMYMLGGSEYNYYYNTSYISADGKNWTLNTNLPSTRKGSAATVYNGKIYITGGQSENTKVNDVLGSSDAINWTQEISEAPWSARDYHTLSSAKCGMFLTGGWDNNGKIYNDIWFSKDGKNWTCATEKAPFPARGLHSAVIKDGYLYVLGGQNTENNSSYYLDDIWRTYIGE